MCNRFSLTPLLPVLALLAGAALYAGCAEAGAASAGDDHHGHEKSGGMSMAGEHHAKTGPASGSAATAGAKTGDPYPLTTCPVSGEELGGMGEVVTYDYHGREIRFCCAGCIKDFEADPEKYIKAIDAEIISQQAPHYPLDSCVVSGEELGGMGEAVDFVYNNRLFKLCCAGCQDQIESDPAAYFSKLDAAVIKAQQASYPLDTCVVTGEKLGSMGDTVDYVFGDRLVRFCCADCIKDFEADPAKYMAQLD